MGVHDEADCGGGGGGVGAVEGEVAVYGAVEEVGVDAVVYVAVLVVVGPGFGALAGIGGGFEGGGGGEGVKRAWRYFGLPG